MRMRGIGAERRTAGIPAKVVEFVAGVRHVYPSHELAIGGGTGVNIHHRHRIGALIPQRTDCGLILPALRRSLHSQFRRGIKRRVGLPEYHGAHLSIQNGYPSWPMPQPIADLLLGMDMPIAAKSQVSISICSIRAEVVACCRRAFISPPTPGSNPRRWSHAPAPGGDPAPAPAMMARCGGHQGRVDPHPVPTTEHVPSPRKPL